MPAGKEKLDRCLNTFSRAPLTLAAFRLALPPEQAQTCGTWYAILAAMEAIRGTSFDWIPSDVEKADLQGTALQAIGKCPSLTAWVESSTCMISPKRWPDLIYPAFAHSMIPTPYELAAANIRGVQIKNRGRYHGALLLHLYALGMSVHTISEILDCGESMVLQQLFLGAHSLSRWAPFKVWASATDFSRARLPTHIPFKSQYDKHEFFRKVDKSPFSAPTKNVEKMVESPSYLSYLIYQSPKKPRVCVSRILHLTKEAR